jgi:putative FmdB family regulatory protein
MPIYAYKCGSCGHAKDVLQKLSDAPLTDCPACGASTFSKQVTAAGFQLKGSGWYATDFRSNGTAAAPAADKPAEKPADAGASKPAEGATVTKSDTPTASAGGCGASCACH